MIRAIIFDWGGVLIDNPIDELLAYFAEALHVSPGDLATAYSHYQSSFYKGLISETEFTESLCRKLNTPLPDFNALWKTAVQTVFKEKQTVFDIIIRLRANGYKTALLSNTEVPTVDYYYEKHYDRYFDEAVFSCYENMAKPDPEIYLLTLNRLNVKATEALFNDDRIENIEGAERMGICSILFESTEQLKKEVFNFGLIES